MLPKSISLISSAMMKKQMYHKYRDLNDQSGDEDMEGKIIVITEGLEGIGKILAKQFAKRQATVIIGGQDIAKITNVANEIRRSFRGSQVVPVKLDLADFDSVRACAEEITSNFTHVDVLINNANYMNLRAVISRTRAGHERHLAANHLGHFLLTLLLLHHLKNGTASRVICVSSSALQMATLELDDLNMEENKLMGEMNLRPYSNSKLCNYLFAKELGKKLEGTDVRSYCVCPGFSSTDLVWFDWTKIMGCGSRAAARSFCASPEEGAETILYCAVSGDMDVVGETGKFYHFRKEWKEIENFVSDEQAEALWEQSESMVGTAWIEVS